MNKLRHHTHVRAKHEELLALRPNRIFEPHEYKLVLQLNKFTDYPQQVKMLNNFHNLPIGHYWFTKTGYKLTKISATQLQEEHIETLHGTPTVWPNKKDENKPEPEKK